MSELYSVTVESVGAEIALRVTTVHPDAGPPPLEPTFPMTLLVDLWSLLDDGFAGLVGGHTLSEEQARSLARQEPWGATFERLCALAFGVDQPVSRAEYDALEAAMASGAPLTWHGRRVGGWGKRNDAYFAHLNGDALAFADAVAPMVASYARDEEQNQGSYRKWPHGDQGKLPSVRLVLRLRDPALAGFVRMGMAFESAAYC